MHKINLLVIGVGFATAIGVITAGVVSTEGVSAATTVPRTAPTAHPYRAAIKTVNGGASAVNKSGYKQAAGVKMHHLTKAQVASALHPKDLATLGGGECTVGYGAHKSQCLPITPPDAAEMGMSVQEMPWTCVEVRRVYPAGIPVNIKGHDPAHLDTNHDGTACGKGDI